MDNRHQTPAIRHYAGNHHSLRFIPNILQFGSKLLWYICWNCSHWSDMWPNPHPPINKVSRTWEMPTQEKHWKWRPYRVRQPISESSQCQPRHLHSQVSQVQMHMHPPPLVPPSPLTQKLSPKDQAGKLVWEVIYSVHSYSSVKSLT